MGTVIFKEYPVTLKSRVGPLHITRRTRIVHENGNEFLQPVTFDWNLDNGFKTAVPKDVWEELREEFLDRKANLKYREALLPL